MTTSATGDNLVVTIQKLSEAELNKRGIFDWDIWEKEVSEFDYHYDTEEQCYFLEGDVVVTAGDATYSFGKGDFVVFPKGLSCTWHINKPVRKHYQFA